MEFTSTQIRTAVVLGARMTTAGAAHLLAEDNVRTTLGIAAMTAAGLVAAVLCRQPLDANFFAAIGAKTSALHSSWTHFYVPALPCPAGRPSGRAFSNWARYILDCYFPGMRQRLAKVREVKGSRQGERMLAC